MHFKRLQLHDTVFVRFQQIVHLKAGHSQFRFHLQHSQHNVLKWLAVPSALLQCFRVKLVLAPKSQQFVELEHI